MYVCMYYVTKLLLLLACLLLLQFEYLLQSDRPSESSQYHRLTLALCRQTPPLRLCKSFSHCMAPAQLLPRGAFCMNPINNKPYACISPCFFPRIVA